MEFNESVRSSRFRFVSSSVIRRSSFTAAPYLRRATIARNQNTYAKRQREADKKAKAEAKRTRRLKRKEGGGLDETSPADEALYTDPEMPDESN